MRRTVVALVAFFVLMQSAVDTASGQPQSSQNASGHNGMVALRYLWWPFKNERRAGRIYYGVSECDGVRWETPFPEILINRPSKNITDAATLRRFFANDPRIRVSDSNGIIRIRFGKIPTAILQTKIAEINLSPEDQYNPELAILKIENAPEVRARMKVLGIRPLNLPLNFLVAPAAPGALHLPPVMKDMSMDDVLDVVATTFHGLVETGYCRKARLMHSDITGYDRH